MPWKTRKQGKQVAIVKVLPGGKTKVVGHSKTKASALASIRAREASIHKKK